MRKSGRRLLSVNGVAAAGRAGAQRTQHSRSSPEMTSGIPGGRGGGTGIDPIGGGTPKGGRG